MAEMAQDLRHPGGVGRLPGDDQCFFKLRTAEPGFATSIPEETDRNKEFHKPLGSGIDTTSEREASSEMCLGSGEISAIDPHRAKGRKRFSHPGPVTCPRVLGQGFLQDGEDPGRRQRMRLGQPEQCPGSDRGRYSWPD